MLCQSCGIDSKLWNMNKVNSNEDPKKPEQNNKSKNFNISKKNFQRHQYKNQNSNSNIRHAFLNSKWIFSSEVPSEKNNYTGGNFVRIKNENLDKILIEFENEWDFEKRQTLFKKIINFVDENYLIIPIYHRSEALMLPFNVKNITDSFKGTTIALPELWN